MARPIKETPVLRGRDAQNFTKATKTGQNNKVSTEELKQVRKDYEALKGIAKF